MSDHPPVRRPLGALLVLAALVAAITGALVIGGQLTSQWLDERAGSSDATPDADVGSVGRRSADRIEPGADDAAVAPERPPGVLADARPAQVVHVVDGDTIHVVPIDASPAAPGVERERVRLLNIDTPERRHPERGRECGAETATDRLTELLQPPAVVWLASDVEASDRFDRSLRYVWNEHGVDVQATLVDEGLAEVLVIRPNERFAAPLRELEAAARAGSVGIWGATCLD